MKTPRYKFDDVWMVAIKLMPFESVEFTEGLIRDYIEKGRDVEPYFDWSNFECAWVLIKAQIDARKARNERARLKRVARKEALLAEQARIKAKEEARRAAEEARRKAEEDAAEALRKERARRRRERGVDRTNCIGRGAKSPVQRPSDRFRGPRYAAGFPEPSIDNSSSQSNSNASRQPSGTDKKATGPGVSPEPVVRGMSV